MLQNEMKNIDEQNNQDTNFCITEKQNFLLNKTFSLFEKYQCPIKQKIKSYTANDFH